MVSMYDYVDLFAGAGGWDVAASSLGLTTLGIEKWDVANRTRHEAGLTTVMGSVLDFDPLDERFETTGLIASPPCQTFSRSGKGSGRAQADSLAALIREFGSSMKTEDERTELILAPLRWVLTRVHAENPFTTILMEEVPEAQCVWDAYAAVLPRLGYEVWTGTLNAADYGAAQSRRRAILLARIGDPITKPEPVIERVSWDLALGITNSLTILESNYKGEAGIKGPEGKLMKSGEKWRLGRRSVGQPGWTVTGRPQKLIHNPGEKPVRLTPQQMGLLQGFPEDYPWHGTVMQQNLQAGNAIPVPLATALLRHVIP